MLVGNRSRPPGHLQGQRHPKRVSPAESVCIRKSPSSESAKSARTGSDNLSVASNIAANGEDLSFYGDQSGAPKGSESARTWFDDSNKNVSGEIGAKFYAGMHELAVFRNCVLTFPDDDPPFFLRHKSSSDESASKQGLYQYAAENNARRRLPPELSLSQNRMVESSSEDFRGVIDDLTVENRRLKKRLQKYEELYCGNLQGDKLFEIRVHGLPASKKRRLERTLQDFASSLGDTGDEEIPSAFAQKLSRVPNRRLAPVPQASSISTSNSRPVDSAYVSMSASGANSDSRVQTIDVGKTSTQSNSNDQNVQSYLQTISRGLLPKHPPVMTEKAKKEVVVKRLEQLFTGSRDSSNKHSQSRQQQEVSQSAANADRRESEAHGHHVGAEGNREAKICLVENQATNNQGAPALETFNNDSSPRDTSSSSVATPDQRPARPLDLDPSRAQDPRENIEYIKHLGFDAPEMLSEKRFREEEGWVYLNLLIGMAQLHILNVTPAFVRESIRDISAKFELSVDGSRIRWKGDNEGTKFSVDSGQSSEHGAEPSPAEFRAIREAGNGKSSKISSEIQSGASWNVNSSLDPSPGRYNTAFDNQRPLLLGQANTEDPYQYRPIFYHTPHSEEDNSSFDGKESPLFSDLMESNSAQDPDGARHGHAPKVAAQSRLRKGADPIIFYNRARFYTDLSKDEESMPYNCPLYDRSSGGVIGCDVERDQDDRHTEGKGLISRTLNQNSVAVFEQSSITQSITGLTDSLGNAAVAASNQDEANPFEASGLGGVVPSDNFSIEVKTEHQERSSGTSALRSKIISVQQTDLLPSSLPPPSYAFLPFSSGSASDEASADDEESDAEMEDAMSEGQEVGRFVATKLVNTFSSGTTRSECSENPDSDDDSSIDLLAHARQIEPEEVAAREREFDDNDSTSSAEMEVMEVDPADSSVVATVGEH
ncbi:hypothetical protein MMC10_003084 [Thelotrema lepadinum]|nr:hypothetical protein [Thelotrema lepadinum]